ncbi:MAG: hypothetical protein ACI81Y_002600 [Glaciecola sp.]|jgi:hypothetical protein
MILKSDGRLKKRAGEGVNLNSSKRSNKNISDYY